MQVLATAMDEPRIGHLGRDVALLGLPVAVGVDPQLGVLRPRHASKDRD